MTPSIKKVLRTTQSSFPLLKDLKDRIYHHSRKWLRIPHESDFRALAAFSDTTSATYLDIGANHGQSVASIRLFKPSVKIVSFEPVENLAKKLHLYYDRDPNWSLRNCGLGAEAGHFILYTPIYNGFVYDGLASFDKGSAMGWLNEKTLFNFDPKKLRIREETCNVERLDDQHLSPDFIKIDVQGFEYDALCGGMETLRRCLPVILIEDYGVDTRVPALVEPLGYYPFRFQDGKFVAGAGKLNTFLMTVAHCEELDIYGFSRTCGATKISEISPNSSINR